MIDDDDDDSDNSFPDSNELMVHKLIEQFPNIQAETILVFSPFIYAVDVYIFMCYILI